MAEQDTEQAPATDQTEEPSGQAEGTQESEGDKEFNQKVWSAAGRIIAKTRDEDRKKIREELLAELKPIFQSMETHAPQGGAQDDAMKRFNEQVQEKLFGGDTYGAYQMLRGLEKRAEANLTQSQNVTLLRGLTTYSDQPYYEDIQSDMQKLTKEKVATGWPVNEALKASYAEAKADFLERKMRGDDRGTTGLGLTGSGRPPGRAKLTKLPPEFEEACARDIADGLYKSKEEWVKKMDSRVKERLGL